MVFRLCADLRNLQKQLKLQEQEAFRNRDRSATGLGTPTSSQGDNSSVNSDFANLSLRQDDLGQVPGQVPGPRPADVLEDTNKETGAKGEPLAAEDKGAGAGAGETAVGAKAEAKGNPSKPGAEADSQKSMVVVEGSLAATWNWPAYALPAVVLQVSLGAVFFSVAFSSLLLSLSLSFFLALSILLSQSVSSLSLSLSLFLSLSLECVAVLSCYMLLCR